jgi:nucleoside-diphosphate-sugar epimerase
MTILVTGANGGFGKVLLPILRAKYKESVIGTGRDKAEYTDYFWCDLTDASSVASLVKEVSPRIIFHLAGSFTGQFENDFRVNTLSAKYLFDSILSQKLDTRVVIFGSAAEYGAVRPEDNPIPETFPCRPVSVYGLTKNYQTEMAAFYARTTNLKIVTARVFNLAIPGLSQRLFFGRAEAMIQSYKTGEISQLVFGNLDSERDYVELESAVEQLLAIADRGITGEIYNVGSGVPKKMRTILMEMIDKEAVPYETIVESSSEAVGRVGFDVPIIYADMTKTSKLKSEFAENS